MNFNKTEWAKAFCLYDGSNGGISYRVTLNDGTEIKSGNWSNTYDQDGTWIIPYTKPRIEKEVKQVRGKRGR
jgi:hypothetical protein